MCRRNDYLSETTWIIPEIIGKERNEKREKREGGRN